MTCPGLIKAESRRVVIRSWRKLEKACVRGTGAGSSALLQSREKELRLLLYNKVTGGSDNAKC